MSIGLYKEKAFVQLWCCHDLQSYRRREILKRTAIGKGLFILHAPTSTRRRRYYMKFITRRVRYECSDWLTCVPKPERHVLRRHIAPTRPVWIEPEGLFRLDAPTTNRRRRYCMKIITQCVRCECSDWLICFLKPERRILRLHNGADASSLNRPLCVVFNSDSFQNSISLNFYIS